MEGESSSYDLSNRPITYNRAGFCRAQDGSIHTDSKRRRSPTVLLYLNVWPWSIEGGRLRLLNGANDLGGLLHEVEPKGAPCWCFKRSRNSWHGLIRMKGATPRRFQINWLTRRGGLCGRGRRVGGDCCEGEGMLRGVRLEGADWHFDLLFNEGSHNGAA